MDRQRFKAAFLAECAAAGLGPDEAGRCARAMSSGLRKLAAGPAASGGLADLLSQVPGYSVVDRTMQSLGSGIGSGITGMLGTTAPAVYFGLPIAAGIGVGGALAKARELNDEDPEEVRSREITETYQREAQRARMTDKLRRAREQRRPSRPLL